MNGIDNETLARWAAMSCCPTSMNPEPALLMLVEQSAGAEDERDSAQAEAEYLQECLRDALALADELEHALLDDDDGDVASALRRLKYCLEAARS